MPRKGHPAIPRIVRHADEFGYKKKEINLKKRSGEQKKRWIFLHDKHAVTGHLGAIGPRDATGGRWVCYKDPGTGEYTDCRYVE